MDTRDADLLHAAVLQNNPRPHEEAKQRVEATVNRLVTLIRRDCGSALRRIGQNLERFRAEAVASGLPTSLLPMPGELLAVELYDSWTDEEKADVQLFAGYCFTAKHKWFVVEGDPEAVQEPLWRYVIDPLPVGILVFGEQATAAPAGVLVTSPMSAWSRIYTGVPATAAEKG